MLSLILAFILVLTSFALSVISILYTPWTSFTYNSEHFIHSLLQCDNCPSNYKYSDYECIKILSCQNKEEFLCELSKKLSQSSKIFFGFEICALIFQLLILKRLTLRAFNKKFGKTGLFLILVWILPLIKAVGLTVFIIDSSLSFDDSEDSLKPLIGIYLQFASTGTMLFASAVIMIFKLHLAYKGIGKQYKVPHAKFLVSILLLMLAQVFYILSFVYPTGEYLEFDSVEIGKNFVLNSEISEERLSLNCAWGQECQFSEDVCDVYKILNQTSRVGLYLNCFMYLSLIFWIDGFFHLMMGTEFSAFLMNLLFPIFYSILMLVGIIYYSINSHIEFGSNCKIEDFAKNWSLCPKEGLDFYILSTIFVFLSSILYIFLYIKTVKKTIFTRPVTSIEQEPNLKIKPSTIVPSLDNSAVVTVDIMKQDSFTITSLNEPNNNLCRYCNLPLPMLSEDSTPYHYKCFILNN